MFHRLAKPASFALVALLGLSLALPAMARRSASVDTEGPTEDQIEIRQLRQQIAAEELAIALDLNEDQRESLTELISEAVARRATHKEERQSKTPELRDLLEDYLSQIQKRGSARESTIEALRAFREANRPPKDERGEQRKEFGGKLKDILSEEQMAVLREFRPMSTVGPDPERAEAREGRREQREDAMRKRFGDEDFEQVRAKKEKRHQRRKTRKLVRRVLFSEAMLDALQR